LIWMRLQLIISCKVEKFLEILKTFLLPLIGTVKYFLND
jgi:hypothetical protein